MTRENRRQAIRFVLLTFIINWGLFGLAYLLGRHWPAPIWMLALSLYMLVPLAVSVVLARFVDRRSVKEMLGIRFRWNRFFTMAWLLPPLLVLLTLGINLFLPGVDFAPAKEGIQVERMGQNLSDEEMANIMEQASRFPVFWLALVSGMVAGISVNAVFAFGEEAGWRGYLYQVFRPLGFWQSSLLIGLIWGLWHAPLILLLGHNYPVHRLAGVGMMLLFCVLHSVVLTYIRSQSGSVLAPAIYHGTINGLGGVSLLHLQGGNDLLNGLTGLAGLLGVFLILLVWIGYGRRQGKRLDVLQD
jgi:membrane protease YdiL (CAAX protease family)